MYTTYVIQNTVSGRFYTGSTNDVNRRLSEHNRGHTKSTHQIGKWVLVYQESFLTNKEARSREHVIKSYKGGNAFKKLVVAVVQG